MRVIEVKGQIFDTSGNQFTKSLQSFPFKIWQKDSFVIEEVRVIRMVSNLNKTETEFVLDRYRFNDLRKRQVYEYLHFSDTAKSIKKYSLDGEIKVIGSWNFQNKRRFDYKGKPENLPDTTIDGIKYQRLRLNIDKIKNVFLVDCYFQCDRNENFFTLDAELSKTIGCPLVKVFSYSPMKNDQPSSNELKFLADTLNDEELKVFAAWEKYARDHPVSK